MVKQKIDFFDSVQFTGDWEFVKEKKLKIKTDTEKDVNSEFYITFKEPRALFAYLFLALAPEQAFDFNKVKQLVKKMRGQNEQLAQKFESCKQALNIKWDGSTALPNIVRQYRDAISEQQQNLIEISEKIEDKQARRIIQSGLSQRKIHLDYHSNDGSQKEQLMAAVKDADNYVIIIFNTTKNIWLLAFLSHAQPEKQPKVQQQQKQKKLQKQPQRQPQPQQLKQNSEDRTNSRPIQHQNQPKASNFVDRPIISVPNPDDRPLNPPPVEQFTRSSKNVPNPDDRPLVPPADIAQRKEVKPVPVAPRQILNPDQKFLIPPSPQDPQDKKFQDLKIVGKKYGQRVTDKVHQLKENIVKVEERFQDKATQIYKQLKQDKHHWIQWGLLAGTVILAVSILRSRN